MVIWEAIHDWVDAPGELVTWDPSPATLAKVRNAPVSPVPASYQQAQHLRAYCDYRAQGAEMARLNIPAWNIAGRCDIRAMTHVINAYLRRHDTYHSWFEYKDTGDVVRRTMSNPRDIKLVPTKHGEVTSAEWRDRVLATPDPLQWNCFSFGVIQRADHFTVYVSVDHLHADAMFMAGVFVEIHMMYAVLVSGGAPIPLPDAGSYHDYCVRQHQQVSALTLESPEVRSWIEFAENNDGTLPQFPLPLGDPSIPCPGAMLTVELMDEPQTLRFESACMAGGLRFSAGVFACAALAEHQLTGIETYYVITPTTTRKTSTEFMTTGWFTGVVPITVPVGETFRDTARAAQTSFDSLVGAAHVPFDRVLELAGADAGLRKSQPGVPMLSYLDAGLPPLSPAIISEWQGLNGRVYSDLGAAHQVGMWVNRFGNGTTVTMAFPDNPIAEESVLRYIDAMKAVYLRVADGGGEAPAAEPCAALRAGGLVSSKA
ncbi:Trehalose-2-sulfate acyltransferase papA2 [Mycobacterium talmoniae]|uniref:Trehalose-2-sulfate acyltransferase papA2 n=1 Tax=Mycobacterium talmoniae TaxID=1858794 RepID=A0A2S8BCS3_9MYCO|nr:condensation domain-containing protein [Mycobacterium eburneum]PQM44467.1 Trehalose-2-sulfate acyltransferase papA2 [Mycobacterium talmoniae]TDH57684.1 acyltransferase [Mycobacterium eburneum]